MNEDQTNSEQEISAIPQAVFRNDQIIVNQGRDIRKRTSEQYSNHKAVGDKIDLQVDHSTLQSNQFLLRHQNTDLEMLGDKSLAPHVSSFNEMNNGPLENKEIMHQDQLQIQTFSEAIFQQSNAGKSTLRINQQHSLLKQRAQFDAKSEIQPTIVGFQRQPEHKPNTPIGPLAYIISKYPTNLIQHGDTVTNYGLTLSQNFTPLVQK